MVSIGSQLLKLIPTIDSTLNKEKRNSVAYFSLEKVYSNISSYHN